MADNALRGTISNFTFQPAELGLLWNVLSALWFYFTPAFSWGHSTSFVFYRSTLIFPTYIFCLLSADIVS